MDVETSEKSVSVRALGFSATELRALKSVCALSTHSSRILNHHVCAEAEPADVFLVDGRNPKAIDQWHALDPNHERPVLLIDGDGSTPGATPMRRPVLASRLLAALDSLFTKPAAAMPAGQSVAAAAAGAAGQERSRFAAASTAAQSGTPTPGSGSPGPAGTGATGLQQGRSRFRVLVVDDSTTVRKHLEIALREMNAHVVTAASGEEALEVLERQEFDLVLLDVVMPGTDGYQVCKSVKKGRTTRGMPVVMLTSKSSPFDKIRGSFAGCDSYLVKPVSHAAFKAVVDKHLAATAAPGGVPELSFRTST